MQQAVLQTTPNNPLVRIPVRLLGGFLNFVLGLTIVTIIIMAHPGAAIYKEDVVPTTGIYLRTMAQGAIYIAMILGFYCWFRSRALAGEERGGSGWVGFLVITALLAMCIYSGTYFAGEPWMSKPGTQTAGVEDVKYVNGWIHALMMLGSLALGWWLTYLACVFDAINPAIVAERARSETLTITVRTNNAPEAERLAQLGVLYGFPAGTLSLSLPPRGDGAEEVEITFFYQRGGTIRDWPTLDAAYASRGLVPVDPNWLVDLNLALPEFGHKYSHTTSWVGPNGVRQLVMLVLTADSDNPSWIHFGKTGPERKELLRSGFWAAGVKPAN